jgi:hypothetical protein
MGPTAVSGTLSINYRRTPCNNPQTTSNIHSTVKIKNQEIFQGLVLVGYDAVFGFRRFEGTAEDEDNVSSDRPEPITQCRSVVCQKNGILNYTTVKTSELQLF